MTLEQQIVNQINDSLRDAIKNTLSAQWNSPLGKLISEAVDSHSPEIKKVVSDALGEFANSDTFRATLKEEMNHKLAKSCVSLLESQVDKSLESIKRDPLIRAKMVLALEKIIIETV